MYLPGSHKPARFTLSKYMQSQYHRGETRSYVQTNQKLDQIHENQL